MDVTPQLPAPQVPPPAVLFTDAYEQFWASVECDEFDADDAESLELHDAYDQFWRQAEA